MRVSHKDEARELLAARMSEFRKLPFADLAMLIDGADTTEVIGPSGKRYQIEINAFWDDSSRTHLRVSGSIDDGGLRAWVNWGSLLQNFLVSADRKLD